MSLDLIEKIDPKKMKKLPIINRNEPSKKYTEKEENYLREICNYEFMNLEEPGLRHKFSYGTVKNKQTFTLFHGGKYALPRFIARHIESCAKPNWKYRPDGMGSMQKVLEGWIPRFQMREVM